MRFPYTMHQKIMMGTDITMGDCIENVIDQLEEELKRRGQTI